MKDHEAARQHYATLLGPVYAWSVGQQCDPLQRGRRWLERRGLLCEGRVLDLGAGFGAHTVALARHGAAVTAVDFDEGLLDALSQTLGDRRGSVRLVVDDLMSFVSSTSERFDLVLCLGDTLTHLGSHALVAELLGGVGRLLAPRGRVALQWRDASGPAPRGLDRFVEVARDRRRTMHCLVEAIDEQRLEITDIVTELTADGPRTRLGRYPKLRLGAEQVRRWAADAQLVLTEQALLQGMTEQHFVRGEAVAAPT